MPMPTFSEELLYRNVHPSFVQDGKFKSSALKPNSNDRDQLSVDRSSLISAENSFKLYSSRGLKSSGVAAVSVRECHEEALSVFEEPIDDNLAHAYVDFSSLSSRKAKLKAAQALARKAGARGYQYQPPSD